LEGLIKDARLAAVSLLDRYLARASVAVPFIVALGFATAALSLDLAARFGASNAFWIMAAGFCTIGIIAGVVVSQRETAAAEAAQQGEEGDQSGLGELGEMATEAATHAAGRLPLGLLAPLFANPAASVSTVARLVGRNLPLVVLVVLIVLLFSLTDKSPGEADENSETTPDNRDTAAPEQDPYREAA
jgi:hypothetical protein